MRIEADRTQANLALALLFVVATLNFVDRQILVILLQAIKEDLKLTDTHLGLLTGPAFALCFAISGIPIAKLAENRSRRLIIAASLTVWSVLTAACGFAQTFLHLMAARIGVAVGEAGSAPASQSMLAELYPHGRRSTALAIFSCSIPIGVLIGLAAGGVLNEMIGWRAAFIAVGVPGIFLAALLPFILKEPARDASSKPPAKQSVLSAVKEIWSIRSYRLLAIGAAIHLFAVAALNQWIAAYLIRTYGVGTSQAGLWLGIIIALVGGGGTLAAGYIADRAGRVDPKWLAWLPALIVTGGVPATIAMYFAPNFETSLLLFIGPVIAATAYTGPVFGTIQSLVPPHLRATAAALTMLLGGVFGQAAGPLAVGMASDLLQPMVGEGALRLALLAVAPVSLLSGWIFWMAGRSMRRDLEGSSAIASSSSPAAA